MIISKIDPTLTLKRITSQIENHFFDRKSGRLSSVDLAHHLSAFANASGGVIALGVENDGTITGVSLEKENAFRRSAFEHLQIPPSYQIELLLCPLSSGKTGNIMLFHVDSSANEIIKLKNGDAYLRSGDSSQKLNSDMLSALEYSKGIKSFESRIVEDATVEDLDFNLIEEYIQRLGSTVSSPLDVLTGRGLIKNNDGKTIITVAAILLFGKQPTQFLPGARVRFLRYDGIAAKVGTEFNIVKDITLEEPLPRLLTKTRELLQSQMREFQQLGDDGVFSKIPEYPAFAWLEGIVNAVAHRDYSLQGDYIRVTMFDDRIEFSSPGKLPSIVTIQNIQTTRFSRNPMIARVLSDFGWVRELNEGVKRIYSDMASYFLDPPVFSEPNGNTVLLTLYNNFAIRSAKMVEAHRERLKPYWKDLDSLDKKIVLFVANKNKCNTNSLICFTEKSRPAVVKRIKGLIEKGILIEHSTSKNDPKKYYTLG